MIEFDSRNTYYKNPFGAIKENADLFFRIVVKDCKSVCSAELLITKDGGDKISYLGKEETAKQEIEKKEEKIYENEETESIYSFNVSISETGLYFYSFLVSFFDGTKEYSSSFQLTVYAEGFTTPDWLKRGIMYQIFPDRFARSNKYMPPSINKEYVLRDDWGGIPNFLPDENGIIQNNDFFGGNLTGIIEKLDYLKELGITVIYLNPIFEAFSNHRYDTGNYMKIDPMLGTENDFINLCREAAEKGIRIILDGVFNHTGSDSLYFNKKGRYEEIGAYQSKDSKYYSWYSFIDYPDKYESWWGIDTLPAVAEEEPEYLDYIIKGENSVVKHWLNCGASGFRLDVADELPDMFLEELRTAIKKTKPDAAIIGEVWEDASNKISYGKRRKYLLGNQLDTVMNYPLKDGVIDYLVNHHNGPRFAETVNGIWENYPKPSYSSLMNILGNHDTERILTVLSYNIGNTDYSRQRLFLAMLIITFMPGIPCIYYGDEIGMEGGKDPFNRKCFEAEKGDGTIYRFYKRLFYFRESILKLSDYDFQPGKSENEFYSFYRTGGKYKVLVAVNPGKQDYLLDLEHIEGWRIKNYFISGKVTLENYGVFSIKENSGIAVFLECTEINTI